MLNNTLDFRLKILVGIFLTLFISACSDENDEPNPDEGDIEELPAMTREELAFSTLAGNFFKSSEPSKGVVLDESKPSERSEACESYEEALEDFERFLPTNEGDEQFISRSAEGIIVSIGDYGTVKFSSASNDGVVARIDINLKDLPGYSVLYRHLSSFGDNYDSTDDLYQFFSAGDLVSFNCPVTRKENNQKCNEGIWGVVIEVSGSGLYIFTNHRHWYYKEDYWKKMFFDQNCPSLAEWRQIYRSYWADRDKFLDTNEHNKFDANHVGELIKIMEGNIGANYVCVEGSDINLHQEKYWFTNTWYSKAKRLKIENMRRGDFTVQEMNYAYRDGWKELDCVYYTLIYLNRSEASNVRIIYPEY